MIKRIFAIFLVIAFGCAEYMSFIPLAHATASVEISDGSVQGLYHFNASDETDSSGNNRTGTLTGSGGSFTTTSTQLGAAAYSEDGSGNPQLSFPSSTTDLSGDFTWAFWFRPTQAIGGGMDILGRTLGPAASAQDLSYSLNCTANHIEWYHDGVCKIDTAYTFQTNVYYLVLLERNGTDTDMYIGGTTSSSLPLIKEITGDTATDNTNQVTKVANTGCSCQKSAMFDEVLIMNKGMTTTTRSSFFNAGTGAEVCTTVGCGSSSSPIPKMKIIIITSFKSEHIRSI